MLLLTSSAIGFAVVSSWLGAAPRSSHPTSLPWIQDQATCEHGGRAWRKNACWDQEHDRTF